MANFELFSSVFKHFRVSLANTFPGKEKDWALFGEFEAEDARDLQTFKNDIEHVKTSPLHPDAKNKVTIAGLMIIYHLLNLGDPLPR